MHQKILAGAEAGARRHERAAEGLRHLVRAIREGGDVTVWADDAARLIAKCNKLPHNPAAGPALVELGVEWLAAYADRLDRYAESARRGAPGLAATALR